MNCVICGRACRAALPHLGSHCCEEHRQEALRRHQALLDDLRREDAALMPEVFSVAEFERFTLKLAVHLLAGISEKARELYRRGSPQMLEPWRMAEELKEHILIRLPESHVRLEGARDLSRLLDGGTYTFKQPVPASLVRQALDKAHLSAILLSPARKGEQA